MPKPKTSPDLSPKPYRLLKTDLAAKLSARNTGGITYLLLADTTDTPELHLAITANEGGGLWSKEAVRLDSIETVLDTYAGQPFPTKALRDAMVGRSSNNPPFCLAVLRDLGLVAPAIDKAHQHVKAGDWQAFRAEWLAKPSAAVVYPAPKVEDGQAVETEPADESATTQADQPEPVTTGKSNKRKKAPVDSPVAEVPETARDDVMATMAAGLTEDAPAPTNDVFFLAEADHAPPAHA